MGEKMPVREHGTTTPAVIIGRPDGTFELRTVGVAGGPGRWIITVSGGMKSRRQEALLQLVKWAEDNGYEVVEGKKEKRRPETLSKSEYTAMRKAFLDREDALCEIVGSTSEVPGRARVASERADLVSAWRKIREGLSPGVELE